MLAGALTTCRCSLRRTTCGPSQHHLIHNMSTRACYTFIDEVAVGEKNTKQTHVYIHHDGYPSAAVEKIKGALRYADGSWRRLQQDLRRSHTHTPVVARLHDGMGADRQQVLSEDDPVFCGALVLLYGGEITPHWSVHGDLEYRYEIKRIDDAGQVMVRSIECGVWNDQDCHELHSFMSFEDFELWAVEYARA
mmetsp:Transcript_78946/g.174908  ORF Transcript_78946/g.174908 Transcript_78946/m.174908 type:complete len:193 (+) Transcript_78946:95-673(+)